MKRAVLWPVVLIATVLVLGGALYYSSLPANEVQFSPSKGDQRSYRIDISLLSHRPDESMTFADLVVMQSVQNYKVMDTGPSLKLHISPRFMTVRSGPQWLDT